MKVYALFLIAVLLLIGACDIKDPVLPKWDVDLSVPLINDIFFVSELTENSDNIIVAEDSVLTVVADGDNTTGEFGNVPFSLDASLSNVPIPGNGYSGNIPFVDGSNNARITYAQIVSGSFSTSFSDINPSVQQIKLIFSSLKNFDGTPLELINTGSNDWVETSLEGFFLGEMNSGQLITSLPYTIQITPALPQGSVAANFSFASDTTIRISNFQGTLTNLQASLRPSTTLMDINYPLGMDQAVILQNASLLITMENYVGFAAKFSGRFKASNDDGDIRYVDIVDHNGNNYYTTPSPAHGTPGIAVFEFENNVSQLLQIMPTRIEIVDGIYTINSGNTIGEVRADDYIRTLYTIKAPLTVVFNDHEIVIRDEQEINIADDNRDRIRDNVLEAKLKLMIQNKLPIGAWANLFISSTPEIDIAQPATYDFVKHAQVASYEMNPNFQTVELSLTKEQLDVFTNPSIFIRWSFSFNNSEHPVTINATTADFIHVKGMLVAKILVEEGI